MPGPTRLALIATTFPLLTLEECSTPGSFEAVCAATKSEGYAGLDVSCLHVLLIGKARFARVLAEHGLFFVGKCYSSGGGCPTGHPGALAAAEEAHPPQGRDVSAHIAVFRAQVRELAGSPLLRPLLHSVSGQSGRDYFSDADADAYFAAADALGAEFGLRIQHETHRHRLLFSPWAARAAVARRPALWLLADLSHYVCVCETGCGDPDLEEAVAALVGRANHTHARVGHEEGPQVPDPSDPRWGAHVEGHAAWWKAIMRAHIARGEPLCTVTPEFLPFPYGPVGFLREETARANAFIAEVVKRAWAEVAAE
jgi:sugar phosphate isomerase/epimerase